MSERKANTNLQVRCLASENTMSNKCQRCARAGRECVYTVHSKTRRRKRTDTRVKELEEKVKNLSMLLEQGKQGQTSTTGHKAKQLSMDIDESIEEEDEESSEDEDEEDDDDNDEAEDAMDEVTTSTKTKASQHYKPPTNRTAKSSQPKTHRRTAPGSQDGTSGQSGLSPDVLGRGMLSMQEATQLFDRYVNILSPSYPSVVFPPGTTAAEVREKRPIL